MRATSQSCRWTIRLFYGPRAYAQTFADAVALGIICDYRVVVAVVDPAGVNSFAMQHGITLVRGDHQATRWVATQIVVSKAIRSTGATKVITFHTRVKQADLFASDTPRGMWTSTRRVHRR